MAEDPDVQPGQIWADNDPRNKGRLIRVLSVHPADENHSDPYAKVTVEKISRNVRKGEVGEQRTIKIRRFRPTRNGYRLVEATDAAEQVNEPYPDAQLPTGDAARAEDV